MSQIQVQAFECRKRKRKESPSALRSMNLPLFLRFSQTRHFHCSIRNPVVACLIACGIAASAHSQELETRRWSHLPIGANVGGGGYAPHFG